MNEEKSIRPMTKDEQCVSCRWEFDRYCAGNPCDGCERLSYTELKAAIFKDSVTHCQCVSIGVGKPCPYYERAEA